jgi:cardiolipin synthase
LFDFVPHIATITAVLDAVIVVLFVPWVLFTKRDSTSAVAWCLIIILVPLLGAFLFWVFGFTHVSRPLRRVRKQRSAFRAEHPPRSQEAARGEEEEDDSPPTWNDLGRLGVKVQGFPVSPDNAVQLCHETVQAFELLLEAITAARHHIHLVFYILRSDATGDRLIEALAVKARAGVQVRLLYDAMGCVRLWGRTLRPLLEAGGQARAFLPLNPLRSRIQVNLRNHRKIAVVDGRVAFTGGMNIADEYLGGSPEFGHWRDSFVRLQGPAVAGLQRVFAEDWHFACAEPLNGDDYFPDIPPAGDVVVQVVESGPDQEEKTIRELFFAAILAAREHVWIATPYFVPDSGLLDALCLARYRDVEVRILTPYTPDHFLTYFAARYLWTEVLEMGMEVYLYKKGMMHSKLMMVDGHWGFIGSANFDNRSLHLSFEVGLVLHTPAVVAELEEQFRRDLLDAERLDPAVFARRPFLGRLAENAARLLSPLL